MGSIKGKVLGFLVVFIGFSGWAQSQELKPVEKLLFNFIESTQIQTHKYSERLGAWPTHSKADGFPKIEETNSFVILQTLLNLQKVNKHRDLPSSYEDMLRYATARLYIYLYESRLTGEPAGTVNYYPVVDYSNPYRRGFKNPLRDFVFKLLGWSVWDMNIPNELDTSSQMYLFLRGADPNHEFVKSFSNQSGLWKDQNRPRQSPIEEGWKPINSGAFLTWTEPESFAMKNTRIWGGFNEVDCVVNLNILSALGLDKHRQPWSTSTALGVQSACEVTKLALSEQKLDQCSPYYGRPSQSLLAFSKANESGIQCLNSSLGLYKETLFREIHRVLGQNPFFRNYLEIAELTVAFKQTIPLEFRTKMEGEWILKLEDILQAGVHRLTQPGKLRTEDPAFSSLGLYRGLTIDFKSPAFSSSMVLLALVLP